MDGFKIETARSVASGRFCLRNRRFFQHPEKLAKIYYERLTMVKVLLLNTI